MQGHWVNDWAHHRCRYPSEYAASKELDHPRNVFLREDLVVPGARPVAGELAHPAHLPGTIKALAEAQEMDVDPGRAAMLEAARRTVADCDQRLAKYRAGLEAGMDPGLVAQWTAEVRAQRLQAEQQLRPPPEGQHLLTEGEIAELVGGIRDIVKTLKRADVASKAAVYRELGLRLTYAPEKRCVLVEATPNMGDLSCPRGDLNSNPTPTAAASRTRLTSRIAVPVPPRCLFSRLAERLPGCIGNLFGAPRRRRLARTCIAMPSRRRTIAVT